MDNIYTLTDSMILTKIGSHLKETRLKQNITQQSLAEAADISLSTIKKIEKGEIKSADALIRTLRTLGLLETLLPLIEEEQISPNEYYKMVHSVSAHQRKRAAGKILPEGQDEMPLGGIERKYPCRF